MRTLGSTVLMVLALTAGLQAAPARAQGTTAAPATAQANPAAATFAAFVESLWPEAQKAGVSRPTFDRAFKGVIPDLTIPDLLLPGKKPIDVLGQAEFVKPPQNYLDRTLLGRLAIGGKAFMARHLQAVEQIEKQLGVDRTILMGIWGRETAYGGGKLPHYGVRVLATQAWTGRRKEMFRAELILALKMLEDRVVTVETMKSSWAGAQGLPQFMPSDYYKHAYDIDGDGKKDIWNSVPDALASAAHQLSSKGWKTGVPWGFEVTLPASLDCAYEGADDERPFAAWSKLGVTRVGSQPIPDKLADEIAYLMSPGGTHGPMFLVSGNFKVLRAYNTSDLYAVFVGHLGDRIAGGGDFVTPWRGIGQLSTAEIAETQERLKAHGLAISLVDGKIGSNTRRQIGLFQRKAGLPVDCWPGAATLARLRQPPGPR